MPPTREPPSPELPALSSHASPRAWATTIQAAEAKGRDWAGAIAASTKPNEMSLPAVLASLKDRLSGICKQIQHIGGTSVAGEALRRATQVRYSVLTRAFGQRSVQSLPTREPIPPNVESQLSFNPD